MLNREDVAMPDYKHLTIARGPNGLWTVTFSNPPINLLEPRTITELQALMSEVETDHTAKVLVFQSDDPDFFIAHFDTTKAAESGLGVAGPTGYMSWIDFVLRLSQAPVISIAKIRGRARGVGNEFLLACDLRFASRQKAIFANPEIGVALVAGGGALEWLPRLVGRSRALEIALSGDDYTADIAERYGWVNRALDDADLDTFVDKLASRLASFDRQALGAVKGQINRIGVPAGSDFESSNKLFFETLGAPSARARRAKLGPGYGLRSDLELNFGRFLVSLAPDTR
jgi:enoyl-CoA hydratase/carnithine racemase